MQHNNEQYTIAQKDSKLSLDNSPADSYIVLNLRDILCQLVLENGLKFLPALCKVIFRNQLNLSA